MIMAKFRKNLAKNATDSTTTVEILAVRKYGEIFGNNFGLNWINMSCKVGSAVVVLLIRNRQCGIACVHKKSGI